MSRSYVYFAKGVKPSFTKYMLARNDIVFRKSEKDRGLPLSFSGSMEFLFYYILGKWIATAAPRSRNDILFFDT